MMGMKEITAPKAMTIFRIIVGKLSLGWRRSRYRNCQTQDMSFVGAFSCFFLEGNVLSMVKTSLRMYFLKKSLPSCIV